MGQRLMHGGKPWTGEGHPPDSEEAVAVRGDADAEACTCATVENEDGSTGWAHEGHAPDCPHAAPDGKKSVVGNAGDGVDCTCSNEWKGEGHAKTCPKRAAPGACDCRALKWDGEGHSPDCASHGVPDGDAGDDEHPVEKRRRKR